MKNEEKVKKERESSVKSKFREKILKRFVDLFIILTLLNKVFLI